MLCLWLSVCLTREGRTWGTAVATVSALSPSFLVHTLVFFSALSVSVPPAIIRVGHNSQAPFVSLLKMTKMFPPFSGVLLRKLEAGIRGISHVIVDEIHERDINVSSCGQILIYQYTMNISFYRTYGSSRSSTHFLASCLQRSILPTYNV